MYAALHARGLGVRVSSLGVAAGVYAALRGRGLGVAAGVHDIARAALGVYAAWHGRRWANAQRPWASLRACTLAWTFAGRRMGVAGLARSASGRRMDVRWASHGLARSVPGRSLGVAWASLG